jgi:hypothetical protein
MIPVLRRASKSRTAADATLARVTSAAIRSTVLRPWSQAYRLQYGLIVDPSP